MSGPSMNRVDADGKLRHEWRKLKVKDHAAEVLQTVRALRRKQDS